MQILKPCFYHEWTLVKKQISKVKVCSQAKTVEKKMHLSLAKLSSDSDCCKCLEALIIICVLVSSSMLVNGVSKL